MIDVALCFSDSDGLYYRKAGTTMLSVFEHTTSEVCVHIVHDDTLPADKQNEMRMLADQYGQHICFHPAPDLTAEVVAKASHWGHGVFYRLFLHKIIQLDKIIYFDCDIICGLDIKELYDHELGNLPLGVVVETGMETAKRLGIPIKKYFNSGVLLINLKWFREQGRDVFDAMMRPLHTQELRYPDQDILNIFFNQDQYNVLYLDEKFNYTLHFDQRHIQPLSVYKDKILHMTGEKPWNSFSNASIFYWKYYNKTPWGSDTFEKIFQTRPEESLELAGLVLKTTKDKFTWFRRYRDFKQFGFIGYFKRRILSKKTRSQVQSLL